MEASAVASEGAASGSRAEEGIPDSGHVSEDQQQMREALLRRLADREGVRAQAQADARARRVESDPNSGPGGLHSRFKALASEARSLLEHARTLPEGSAQRADAQHKAGALAAELDSLCVRHAHELLTRDLELAQLQASEIRKEAESMARAGPSGASGKKFGFQKKVAPVPPLHSSQIEAPPLPSTGIEAPPPPSTRVEATPAVPAGVDAAAGRTSGPCDTNLTSAAEGDLAGRRDAAEGSRASLAEGTDALHQLSGHLSGNGTGERDRNSRQPQTLGESSGVQATASLQSTGDTQPLSASQATGNSGKTVIEGKVGETSVLTPSLDERPPELMLLSLTDCSVTVQGVSASVHCRGLVNCHVALGPVLGAVHLTGLSRCSVTVCCHQLRLHECDGLKLFARVGNRAIMEDCTGVSLGPYSMAYPGLEGDLERAKMQEENGLWKEPRDFSWLRQTPSPNWKLIE